MFWIITIAINFGISVLNGWVIKVLYDWFLLNTFDLPEITIFHGVGLAILIGHITRQDIPPRETDDGLTVSEHNRKNAIRITINGIVQALVVLLTGWIFHFFV